MAYQVEFDNLIRVKKKVYSEYSFCPFFSCVCGKILLVCEYIPMYPLS